VARTEESEKQAEHRTGRNENTVFGRHEECKPTGIQENTYKNTSSKASKNKNKNQKGYREKEYVWLRLLWQTPCMQT